LCRSTTAEERRNGYVLPPGRYAGAEAASQAVLEKSIKDNLRMLGYGN